MTRSFAGIFDPDGRRSGEPARALLPLAAQSVRSGPLHVACTGPPPRAEAPVCLLDGFIDNAAELATLLGGSPADPESLLARGWRRWGERLPARLRGDFAILIWDPASAQGLLARDQIGARPMYLSRRNGMLSFAGELRHLLALLPSRPEPDDASVAHWLAMSSRPGPATMYREVERLEPGTVIMLGDAAATRRYWQPRFTDPITAGAEELAAEVRRQLSGAVARRLSASGPTGVLLSGGLDSAAVAALAADSQGTVVLAYSAVFPDHPGTDERQRIAGLRRALALHGTLLTVRPGGLLRSVQAATEHARAPLLGWGDFWTLPLLRLAAADGVSVVLGGDGGDEVFGTRSYLLADELRHGHPLSALALTRAMPGAGARPPRREQAKLLLRFGAGGALAPAVHAALARRPAASGAPAWMLPSCARLLRESDDPEGWKRLDGPRWWANLAHGLTRRLDEIGIFEHQRRRAAAAGVESRHPMLDLELVEAALRQPPHASFDPERNRPLLRAALRGTLPEDVRLAPRKAWFDGLIEDSLDLDGEAIRELIGSRSSEIARYADVGRVARELLSAPRRGGFTRLWGVWRLVTMEVWLRSLAGRLPAAPEAPQSIPRLSPVKLGGVALQQPRANPRFTTSGGAQRR